MNESIKKFYKGLDFDLQTTPEFESQFTGFVNDFSFALDIIFAGKIKFREE